MRGISVVGILVATTILLTSCARDDLIPAGSENLEECPLAEYSVENLASTLGQECDPHGSALVFPDGFVFVIGEIGQTRSQAMHVREDSLEFEYRVVNLGLAGVAATRQLQGEGLELWGSSEDAVRLYNAEL